jgi:branched-chain amino acid transport system substrate-binding protein
MKKLAVTTLAITTALLTGFLATGCSAPSDDPGSPGTASAGTLKIALLNPLTGTAAQYGKDLHQGQLLAIKQLNADGGDNGQQINAIEYDDQNLPQQGVTLAQRAIAQDGVKYIVGTNGSNVALAIRNVTEKEGVVYIVGSAKGPTVTDDEHKLVFRVNTNVTQDSEFFYSYLDNLLHPQKMAIIQEQSDTGQAVAENLAAYFKDRVQSPIITELTTTDFAPFSSKLQQQDPDVVFLANGGSTSACAASIKQLKQAGMDMPKALGPGTVNGALLDLVGTDIDGVVTADVYSPALETAANKAFVEAYEAEYGEQPNVQSELGYEQIMMLAAAITKAGGADNPAKVAEILHSETFDTPRGKVSFDATGQAIPESGLTPLTVKNGNLALA